MDKTLLLILSFLAGGLLGTFFFGGLWLTVRIGTSSRHPALWFLGSLLLRMGLTMLGFYFVSEGHWKRMLGCVLGFVTARLAITWITMPSKTKQTRPKLEAMHAPHS